MVRGLIAKFWENPFETPVTRWGNILHDRWMMPHFLSQDLGEVVADLCAAGMTFDAAWYHPHLEFRFPRLGGFVLQGTDVEIRHALEPWHVLGEEQGGGGAVRYVDSSVERVQVKVQVGIPDRHTLLCNGARIPLHSTGTDGEFVAGVRYRAWQPPNCLHPTISVHSPLTFELYDEWAKRSVTGVTYHVMHPGGRAYETNPVNANEAESRRFERFQPFGYTQGTMVPRECPPRPEAPLTLDLRWV